MFIYQGQVTHSSCSWVSCSCVVYYHQHDQNMVSHLTYHFPYIHPYSTYSNNIDTAIQPCTNLKNPRKKFKSPNKSPWPIGEPWHNGIDHEPATPVHCPVQGHSINERSHTLVMDKSTARSAILPSERPWYYTYTQHAHCIIAALTLRKTNDKNTALQLSCLPEIITQNRSTIQCFLLSYLDAIKPAIHGKFKPNIHTKIISNGQV